MFSNEDAQNLDAARVGAAIRLAILLLASSSSGTLLHDGAASLSVTADDSGASYSIVGTDGEVVDSGEKWEPLIARLGADRLDAERAGTTVTPEGELSADEATPSFGADGLMPV